MQQSTGFYWSTPGIHVPQNWDKAWSISRVLQKPDYNQNTGVHVNILIDSQPGLFILTEEQAQQIKKNNFMHMLSQHLNTRSVVCKRNITQVEKSAE